MLKVRQCVPQNPCQLTFPITHAHLDLDLILNRLPPSAQQLLRSREVVLHALAVHVLVGKESMADKEDEDLGVSGYQVPLPNSLLQAPLHSWNLAAGLILPENQRVFNEHKVGAFHLELRRQLLS